MHVIVVGAGIVGYAIAYELASRGAQVHVIDDRGAGQGATRASAGILAPYIEGHGTALLELGLRSLEQYDSFISRVAADARLPIEYRRTGTLQVARTDLEAGKVREQAKSLAAAGITHALMNGEDARRLEPALAESITAGLLIEQHGHVGAASLMAALVAAAAHRDASFSVARVESVSRDGQSIAVQTSNGAESADAVVIAAGAWSSRVPAQPSPAAPVRPVRGQLLHLRVPDPPLSRVVWGASCYLVPWQDGSVLVGATVEDVGFDESITENGILGLLESGEQLLPVLGSAVFVEARAGLRPVTPDELPIIGASSTMPGVYYATGHYRNGVLLAPLTAAMIGDLIVDGRPRPELDLVRPDRFGL